ncbi:MAG TPA: MBL fold metallo-hydrolase, partial [Thermoanaerobaculia bacterium]
MRGGGLALRLAAPALAVGWLAARIGWTAPERPWREATGWRRVPPGERPSAVPPWPAEAGEPPRLTWLGHSGFLVEWHGRRILLDPHTGARCTLARRVLERPLRAADLGAVDAALISHAHYDHLDLPTLAAVPRLDLVVVPAGSERWAARLPERVRVAGAGLGETVDLAPLAAVAVPAAHNGHRHHPLGGGRRAIGWVLRSPSAALYFAGDTG